MLYKLDKEETSLSSMPFFDLSKLDLTEKEFEGLLANHLLEVLYEESPLMPIYREKKGQSKADLYALNEKGDLIIFELKLRKAGSRAVKQILKYTEEAGQWTFKELSDRYKEYAKEQGLDLPRNLLDAHQEAFEIEEEHKLTTRDFNKDQHLQIIGRAADKKLIKSVEYWKNKGISIAFLPYRVYKIDKDYYFELFSPPYDQHHNPRDIKGVLFDTNKKYDKTSVLHMMEKNRVSAFGGAAKNIDFLNIKDIVLYKHRGCGVIAAAKVISQTKKDIYGDNKEKYRKVKFLTPKPKKQEEINKYLSFKKVSELLDQKFFWAAVIANPYLTKDEAELLIKEVKKLHSE
ncbi:MAG: hypothetical protein K9K76_07625 [Halanaerobiales bacterium]|nr:hypothetical protein [Halanaerobiales bacterium]